MEKKVALGAEELLLSFGPAFIVQVALGMATSDRVRPGILVVLSELIVREFAKLTTGEQVVFMTLVKNFRDETAQSTGCEVDFDTYPSLLLKTVEPYLVPKVGYMDVYELVSTYEAYSNPHVPIRHDIVDELEAHLIQKAKELIFLDTIQVLFILSNSRIGSEELISKLH